MKQAHMLLFLFLVMSIMNFHFTNAQITQPNPPFGFTLGENLKASLSVIIISFFSALAFMGIFSLYLRYCSYNDQYGSINHRNPIAAAAELCRRGFNRHVIDKCPILIYSKVKDLKIGKGTLECAVCLNEFEDNDEIRLLPKCHHVFHPHCIDVWLLSHMNCPVCRARLTSDMANIAIATPILTSNTETSQTTTTPEHGRGHDETENEQHQHVEEERQSSTITGTEEAVTPDISVMKQTVPSRESRITFGKFLLRSHSTGHSLVEEPEEKVMVAVDRHTLRLPEQVRKQILVDHERIRSLTRSDVALPGLWSSKRTCYRSNNNNNYLEWWTSMTPPRGGETTCWTPLRMSFYETERSQKPLHVLPV